MTRRVRFFKLPLESYHLPHEHLVTVHGSNDYTMVYDIMSSLIHKISNIPRRFFSLSAMRHLRLRSAYFLRGSIISAFICGGTARRQEQCGDQEDHADDHQHFDERKTAMRSFHGRPFPLKNRFQPPPLYTPVPRKCVRILNAPMWLSHLQR